MDEGRCGEVSIMLFLWWNSAFRPVLSPPDLNFWLLFCLTNGHSVNTFAATFLASVVYMTLHGFNLVLSCLLLLLLALFHKTLESYQSLLMKKTLTWYIDGLLWENWRCRKASYHKHWKHTAASTTPSDNNWWIICPLLYSDFVLLRIWEQSHNLVQ